MPRISIVIPAYNAERYLPETVEAIRAQTQPDWECVIVDDGSTDGTPALADALAAQDGRIRVVHQANGGLSAARNSGFDATDPSSEYVIFIDADDVWEQDALESLSSALEANPQAVAAYGLARYIDSHGNRIREGEAEAGGRERHAVVGDHLEIRPLNEPTTFAMLAFRNRVMTSGAILIRRCIYELVAPFDGTLTPCEDYDMWLRLTLKGDLAFVDKVVLNYRRHDSNMSYHGRRMEQGLMRVRRKLMTLDLTEEQRRIAQTGYRLWEQGRVRYRLQSAKDNARSGRVLDATRDLYHAARFFVRLLRGLPDPARRSRA